MCESASCEGDHESQRGDDEGGGYHSTIEHDVARSMLTIGGASFRRE